MFTRWIETYRLAFAALVVVAICTQAISLGASFDPVNYFSYFTIDSNLIAVIALLASILPRSNKSPTVNLLRGAAVVYMTVTGVVFTLLLSGTDVDTAIPWVNTVVHELMPMVILADWLLVPPIRLRLRESLLWLCFPLAWLVYTLIRGAVSGRYPYPFLNPARGGYASVSVYVVAIMAFMVVLSVGVSWAGSWRGRPTQATVRPDGS